MEVVQDKFTDCLWNLHQSQDSGKSSGGSQNEQDWCESADGFHQNPPDITDVDAPVNKKTDDQRIKYRNNSGLCRRGNTTVDTAQDDDRT